jgi:hypothetical protein
MRAHAIVKIPERQVKTAEALPTEETDIAIPEIQELRHGYFNTFLDREILKIRSVAKRHEKGIYSMVVEGKKHVIRV